MSMFNMLQNFPNQCEELMKIFDHTKATPNANIVPQKMASQQVNALEAMPTMFKEKVEVPPFFLSIQIDRRNLHNFLIDS
jgi:hypothetical protein